MKANSNLTQRTTRLCWGVIISDVLFMFIAPLIDQKYLSGTPALLLAIWLILSLIGTSTFLIIRYRFFFTKWIGWALPFLSLFINMMFIEKILTPGNSGMYIFFLMLCLVSIWSIFPVTIILLYYRDTGLELIAWMTLSIVWFLLIGGRFQGNLIELLFTKPLSLWWLPFIGFAMAIMPLGIISFIGHTIRLIGQELGEEIVTKRDQCSS